MARGPRDREKSGVPKAIERFIKALVVTAKAVVLYPPASNIPLQTAEGAEEALKDVLRLESELRLAVTKNGLLFRGQPLLEGYSAYESLSLELYRRGLAEVRFHSGARARDIVAFLAVLKYEPETVRSSGGFEARLWEQGVGAITVTEAHFTMAGEDGEGGTEALEVSEQPPRSELDEALAAAYAGRSREQVVITRLMGRPPIIARYLADTCEAGGPSGCSDAAQRLSELVAVAYESADEETRGELEDALREALEEISPEMRRSLLVDHALPEARTSAAMARFVESVGVDELCRMLVEGAADSAVSREGLARAIRTLAMVSGARREDVVASARAALVSEGCSESFIGEVIELAAPTQVRAVAEGGAAASAEQEEAILRLVEMAPSSVSPRSTDEDPDRAAMIGEARRGITDGDVILALVDLVCIDSRDVGASPNMAALEDTLEVLMERGEIDVAADAAEALRAASTDQGLSDEQRRRIEHVLQRFSRREDMGVVTHALRLYPPDSPEHRAAQRLIDALGSVAIEPVLEQLAEEPDMGVRKMLVELLSPHATDHVAEFASHLTDPRWYFVRNVVNILGSTHSTQIVSYLEKTLRHPEPRVRRETIRALSGLQDRRAHAMLVVALSDDDEQNVLLAARYLGLASVEIAVPALEGVAKGEGRGSRAIGPRVEAIEALGRIGNPAALVTLETLAGKRALRRGGGVREIRTAAAAAIGQIRSREQ